MSFFLNNFVKYINSASSKVEIKLKVISADLDALKGTSKVLSQKDILFCNSSIFNLNILS